MQHSETVDLTNCDREPIHIPGSIQPHGCLLACDASVVMVLRHSANAPDMLSIAGDINGQPLDHFIGPDATHTLRNALATSNDATRPALVFGLRLPGGGLFDVTIHRFKSSVIIEFEPTVEDHGHPLELARTLIGRISGITAIDKLTRDGARLVHAMLGYDRVMIYRFEHDGAGKVVSEYKRGDLESFLGQYFPASDIPQQARILYLKNTLRIISDADFKPVPVMPTLDASGEPLDLSFAHLRSVSPIHCEYLRNMGVAASMSISIIVDGALWGLIACHHYSPRVMPMTHRVAAEMFGEFFSLHLNALKNKRKLDVAGNARKSLDRFLQLASHSADIGELLRDYLPDFAGMMACDGVGLWINGNWSAYGETPPSAAVPAMARFINTVADARIWATHALSQSFPDAADYAAMTSGVLAIPLSQRPRDYLLFFRKEVMQTLDWAGNPDKTYETGPLGDRLTPRKSFAIWKENIALQSEPWSEADREIAEATRAALVEIVLRHSELIADERAKADVRQRMLNDELNHRVKNILAVIKSLVGHPVGDGVNLHDYVNSLKGRIQALAFAHDQVVRGDGGGALSDLLNAELSPYRDQSSSISLNGPGIWLDARAFSVMALVLHELSTNAAKYGALSRTGGRLAVDWNFSGHGDCEIHWRESGGPRVLPPSRQGFGTVLIDRSVPYDLDGESDVTYEPEGVQARFMLPKKHVSVAQAPDEATGAAHRTIEKAGARRHENLSLLLVEDQMLIAMDVEDMLAAKGILKVTTSGSANDALKKLKTLSPDVAVLDVNLGTGTSMPVAEALTRRDIPFVFATGYGDTSIIPDSFAGVPIVRKPYDGDALHDAITSVLTDRITAA
jgi:light-regulated signal transduction histidine kinase (bacteriophytochrome)/CheY-like chemotaxis protein